MKLDRLNEFLASAVDDGAITLQTRDSLMEFARRDSSPKSALKVADMASAFTWRLFYWLGGFFVVIAGFCVQALIYQDSNILPSAIFGLVLMSAYASGAEWLWRRQSLDGASALYLVAFLAFCVSVLQISDIFDEGNDGNQILILELCGLLWFPLLIKFRSRPIFYGIFALYIWSFVLHMVKNTGFFTEENLLKIWQPISIVVGLALLWWSHFVQDKTQMPSVVRWLFMAAAFILTCGLIGSQLLLLDSMRWVGLFMYLALMLLTSLCCYAAERSQPISIAIYILGIFALSSNGYGSIGLRLGISPEPVMVFSHAAFAGTTCGLIFMIIAANVLSRRDRPKLASLFYYLGGISLLIMCGLKFFEWKQYGPLYMCICAFMMFLGVILRRRSYTLWGAFALTINLLYVLSDFFDGQLVAPIILLILGSTLIAGGFLYAKNEEKIRDYLTRGLPIWLRELLPPALDVN